MDYFHWLDTRNDIFDNRLPSASVKLWCTGDLAATKTGMKMDRPVPNSSPKFATVDLPKLGVDTTRAPKGASSKQQSNARLFFLTLFTALAITITIALSQPHLPFSGLTLSAILGREVVIRQHDIERRASKVLEDNPLIDGHNDLLIRIRGTYGPHIYDRNFTQPFENGTLKGQVDLPRMLQGRYAGAFWSAFWLCPKDIFDFSTEAYDPSMKSVDQIFPPMKRGSCQKHSNEASRT